MYISVSKSAAFIILYILPTSLASFVTALAAICTLAAHTAALLTDDFTKASACVADFNSLLEALLLATACFFTTALVS